MKAEAKEDNSESIIDAKSVRCVKERINGS